MYLNIYVDQQVKYTVFSNLVCFNEIKIIV